MIRENKNRYLPRNEEGNYGTGYLRDAGSGAGYADTGFEESAAFGGAAFLKFVSVVLILVYIMLLLIYTSGSTKPFADIAAEVEQNLDTETLVKMDTQALKRYYGLNSADYEGVMLYASQFNISAEEVLMIEVKSDQQMQEVRDAVDKRLETRLQTFEGYAPEQVQLIEQAQIQVRGQILFLAVSPHAESYAAAFAKSL